MSTMAMLGLAFVVVVGAVVGAGLAFGGMLVFGYWQHYRAGRKEHKAPEAGE